MQKWEVVMTPDELKAALSYDALTGTFTRLTSAGGKQVGSVAGTVDAYGYLVITLNKKIYKAHRLAWMYTYGAWPSGDIDHINQDKQDNRIENLRVSTPAQNKLNISSYTNSSSDKLGVCYDSVRGCYVAQFKPNGVSVLYKRCDTEEEASRLYTEAKKKYQELERRAV